MEVDYIYIGASLLLSLIVQYAIRVAYTTKARILKGTDKLKEPLTLYH